MHEHQRRKMYLKTFQQRGRLRDIQIKPKLSS